MNNVNWLLFIVGALFLLLLIYVVLANQQITIQFAFEMPNYCHLMKKYDYNLFF